MTELETIRRLRSKVAGLEAEVTRLESALKKERQRSEEWKLRAAITTEDAERARYALNGGKS